MEEVGALPQRAPVGHGARGLQRQRRRLELLQPRPGALARLPLGRGRPGRHQRRPPGAVLRAGAVERPGPDPEGARLRPGQQRGQPRRGRQGVLLLPRQHADALVHEVPVQVPAGGLSLRRPGADQPPARQARARVRTAGHRRVRGQPLLRRLRRICQGRARGPAGAHHRGQPRPRGRAAARAADTVVPQHLVAEERWLQAPVEGVGRRRASGGACASHRSAVPGVAERLPPACRCRGAAALHRERDQPSAAVRHGQRVALREGRLSQLPDPRRRCGSQPGRQRHQGGVAPPARRGCRHDADAAPAPDGRRGGERRPSPTSTRCSPSAWPRPMPSMRR